MQALAERSLPTKSTVSSRTTREPGPPVAEDLRSVMEDGVQVPLKPEDAPPVKQKISLKLVEEVRREPVS